MVDECLAKLGDDDEEEPEKFTDEALGWTCSDYRSNGGYSRFSGGWDVWRRLSSKGRSSLANLATKALTRYVRGGGPRLFLPGRNEGACSLSVLGRWRRRISLGRSRVRLRSEQLGVVKLDEVNIFTGKVRRFADEPTNQQGAERASAASLSSLEYFQSTVPMLNVEPLTWLPEIERQAFTMAVATEQQLLEKVRRRSRVGLPQASTAGDPRRFRI